MLLITSKEGEMSRRYTEEDIANISSMLKEGFLHREIADILNVNRKSISYLREEKYKRRFMKPVEQFCHKKWEEERYDHTDYEIATHQEETLDPWDCSIDVVAFC